MIEYLKGVASDCEGPNKNQTQNDTKIDFKKWAREVEKICGHHVKLT